MPSKTLRGGITGTDFALPDVNATPMPSLAAPGVIVNGEHAAGFGDIREDLSYPDVRSFRRKFGLLIPATNTSMEHELWSIVFNNFRPDSLEGVGLHTTNVVTPRPKLESEEDLLEYKRQFLNGLDAALEQALLAQPEFLIMGMSLEHILTGIDAIRASMAEVESRTDIHWATWHDAISAALKCFRAKRIGLITPFDRLGNENATRMFEDLGYDVVASVGFSCANALHIAHVPDWAKEKAILELLATPENKLDAVVQCGTNMSIIDVVERLEPRLGIPVLGINAVTFWYALRESGLTAALNGAGRLYREF